MIELVASPKEAAQPLTIGGHHRIRGLVGRHHEHVGLEAALSQPCPELLLRLNQTMAEGAARAWSCGGPTPPRARHASRAAPRHPAWGDGAALGRRGHADGRAAQVPPGQGLRGAAHLAAVMERAIAQEPGLLDLAVGT
jgi:hypothetical protein